MNKAILVQSDDWEGLYINGKLVKEGHTINGADSRISYFVTLSKEYSFNLEDLDEYWISNEDDEKTKDMGCFPDNINELSGDYGK